MDGKQWQEGILINKLVAYKRNFVKNKFIDKIINRPRSKASKKLAITEEINVEINEDLETQNEIIKTLHDDLNLANEEIQELKMHKVQLETLVLKKEETIMLEKKLMNSIQ